MQFCLSWCPRAPTWLIVTYAQKMHGLSKTSGRPGPQLQPQWDGDGYHGGGRSSSRSSPRTSTIVVVPRVVVVVVVVVAVVVVVVVVHCAGN